MTLTQITEHSLTKTNYGSINFDGEGRSGSPHSPIRGFIPIRGQAPHSLVQARTSPTMPNHRVVKIPTICLKFPLSPRLPISSSIFFKNETALATKVGDWFWKNVKAQPITHTV